jgi:hypothetical protein
MGKRHQVKKRKGLEKSQSPFRTILSSIPLKNHQRAMLLNPAKRTSHFDRFYGIGPSGTNSLDSDGEQGYHQTYSSRYGKGRDR